jgi:hypothetical protein
MNRATEIMWLVLQGAVTGILTALAVGVYVLACGTIASWTVPWW